MNLNENKLKVIDDLLDAGNQCLIRFNNGNELASEYDKRVFKLYQCFEIFFLHGLRDNPNPFNLTRKMISNSLSNSPKNFNNYVSIKDHHNPDFWKFVTCFLNKYEIERFTHLKYVRTSLGRCRAWLRSSLNEHTLERYLKLMLENGQTVLKQFYDEGSAIRSFSKQNEILELVSKLNQVFFSSVIDNPNLNTFNTINNNLVNNKVLNFDDLDQTADSIDNQPTTQLNNQQSVENKLSSTMQNLSTDKKASTEDRASLNSSSNLSRTNSSKLDLNLPLSRNSSYSSNYQQDDLNNLDDKSDEEQIDPNVNKCLLTPIVAGNYSVTDQFMTINYDDEDKVSDCNTSCSSTPAFQSKELANFEKTKRLFEKEFESISSKQNNIRQMENNRLQEQYNVNTTTDDLDSELNKNKIQFSSINSSNHQSGYEERLKRLESQNERLKQENKLLKDQLMKYIDAISLLQTSDRDAIFKCANNSTTNLINDDLSEQQISEESTKNNFHKQTDYQGNENTISTAMTDFDISAYLNYRDSVEYERKLVQVAEMHNEVIEFNDRLHRVLMQKDAIIRRLKDQLVEFRPLPDNIQSDDEEIISIASDNENQSLQFNSILTQSRPLINIYIPSAFLADHKQTYQNNYLTTDQQKSNKKVKSHHVYQIYICIKGDEWNVYRRYSQFYMIHQILKKKYQQISELEFPPKKTIGNRNAKVVQERRKKLEAYLRNTLNILQSNNNIYDRNTLIEVLPFLSEKFSIRNVNQRDNESNASESVVQQQDYVGL